MAFLRHRCVRVDLYVGVNEISHEGQEVMEYTAAALLSVVVVLILDERLHTRLVRRPVFWVFMGVMAVFMTLANGYLTGRPIVLYGTEFFSNVRLATIPLEDYAYGFSLITLSIVLWEYLSTREGEGEEGA
jgi:lycopene cyclase domain-containing protein